MTCFTGVIFIWGDMVFGYKCQLISIHVLIHMSIHRNVSSTFNSIHILMLVSRHMKTCVNIVIYIYIYIYIEEPDPAEKRNYSFI